MNENYYYTPENIIKAYSLGIFPMAENHNTEAISFYEPIIRGIIPLNPPKIPKKLLKLVKKSTFNVTVNYNFKHIIDCCSEITNTRTETWINPKIKRIFLTLHKMGFAHSIEVWFGDEIVGGLYGLTLGSVFFGESMFSKKSNASKVALTHLIYLLKTAGFKILDAQFPNNHLRQFGLIEINKDDFKIKLNYALQKKLFFPQKLFDFNSL